MRGVEERRGGEGRRGRGGVGSLREEIREEGLRGEGGDTRAVCTSMYPTYIHARAFLDVSAPPTHTRMARSTTRDASSLCILTRKPLPRPNPPKQKQHTQVEWALLILSTGQITLVTNLHNVPQTVDVSYHQLKPFGWVLLGVCAFHWWWKGNGERGFRWWKGIDGERGACTAVYPLYTYLDTHTVVPPPNKTKASN